MKIAYYKAFQKRATKLDWLIAICTLGRYSHTELVFSDGQCFSISPREKIARFKKIDMCDAQFEVFKTEFGVTDKYIDDNFIKWGAK